MPKNQPTGTYDFATGRFVPFSAQKQPVRARTQPKKKRKTNGVILAVSAVLLLLMIVIASGGNQSDADDPAETEPARAAASGETDGPTLYRIDDTPAQPEPDPEPEPVRTWEPEPDYTWQPEPEPEPVQTWTPAVTVTYVLNTNSKKIHKPDCNDVAKIKPENYATTDDPETWLSWGYTNCGHCGGCG